MQGVSMVEDMPDEQHDDLVSAVRRRLTNHAPVAVQFHRPVVRPEAIVLPAIPSSAVERIRDTVRAGMTDVLGADAVPEQAEGFQPHVSLAYVNRDQTASAVVDTIDRADEPDAAAVDITHASLIEMHRDNRMYEWRRIANAPIATTGA